MTIFMRFGALFVASMLVAANASAQDPLVDQLTNHLIISQSLKDKNVINEPAFATLNIPDTGSNTNNVAVAVTAVLDGIDKNPKFNIGAASQFNQNSTQDNRQNLFQAAAKIVARTGPAVVSLPFYFVRVQATAGYKHDGEKHSNGATANAYVTFEKYRTTETAGAGTDSSAIPLFRGVAEFTPQAGMEFDDVIHSADPTNKGTVTRTLVSLNANLYPFGTKRFVLSGQVDYRYDVQTDFHMDRNHTYGQVSGALFLDSYNIFSIGVDRVMGDDPSQAFTGPDFWRLSLKVQLARPQKRALRRGLIRAPAAGSGIV